MALLCDLIILNAVVYITYAGKLIQFLSVASIEYVSQSTLVSFGLKYFYYRAKTYTCDVCFSNGPRPT